MPLEICDATFVGSYLSADPIKNEAGVFIVMGAKEGDEQFKIVDAGVAQDVRAAVSSEDRKSCWDKYGFTKYAVAVHYDGDEKNHQKIVERTKSDFASPCVS